MDYFWHVGWTLPQPFPSRGVDKLRVVGICLLYWLDRVDGVNHAPVHDSTKEKSKQCTLPQWSCKSDSHHRNCRACVSSVEEWPQRQLIPRMHVQWLLYTMNQIEVPGTSRNRVRERPLKRPNIPSFLSTSRITLRDVDFFTDLSYDCSIWSRHFRSSTGDMSKDITAPEPIDDSNIWVKDIWSGSMEE